MKLHMKVSADTIVYQRYWFLFCTTILSTMSYTSADIRKLIDDLDDNLWAAVLDGTIEQRYAQEWKKVVSVYSIYVLIYV